MRWTSTTTRWMHLSLWGLNRVLLNLTLVTLIIATLTLTVAPAPLPSAGANSGDAAMAEAAQTPVSSPQAPGVPELKRTPVRKRGKDRRGGRSKKQVHEDMLRRRRERYAANKKEKDLLSTKEGGEERNAKREAMLKAESEAVARMLVPQTDNRADVMRLLKFDFFLRHSPEEKPGQLRQPLPQIADSTPTKPQVRAAQTVATSPCTVHCAPRRCACFPVKLTAHDLAHDHMRYVR